MRNSTEAFPSTNDDSKQSPSREELDALGDRIAETAAHIDAATHELLSHIRDFDEAGGWHAHGAQSCAHWLNWRVGLGLGAAREHVRVARKLAELPLVDDALARGHISYSKVRAITRVADADSDALFLQLAQTMTAAQLEKTCRVYRQATLGNADRHPRAADSRRWVRMRDTDDGMVRITAQLRPEEASSVGKAIERIVDQLRDRSDTALDGDGSARGDVADWRDSTPAPGEPGGGPNRADGLVAMAEAALCGSIDARAIERPPVEVAIHVDAATLRGHTDDGTGIPAETSRRLCCDAGIVCVVEDAHAIGDTTTSQRATPMDVGRKTRAIPTSLRRALQLRDDGCRFPGCENRRWLDAHHIVHWIDGGETSLDNVLSLCRFHHRCVHELGYRIEAVGGDGRDGAISFRHPSGYAIPAVPPRPPTPTPVINDGDTADGAASIAGADALRCRMRARGAEISAETNAPQWDGRSVDYGHVIDGLLWARRAGNDLAEQAATRRRR